MPNPKAIRRPTYAERGMLDPRSSARRAPIPATPEPPASNRVALIGFIIFCCVAALAAYVVSQVR